MVKVDRRRMGQIESREGAGDAVLLCVLEPKMI